ERAFQRAITLQPNLAVSHHWYALYLMAMGRAEESIAELHRTLALDPLFPIVPTNLGRAYAFAGRLQEAVAHFRLTLEMDPDFVPAQFELARMLGLQGQFAEARAVCRAARAGAPDSVRPLVATAWVEARAGAADAARWPPATPSSASWAAAGWPRFTSHAISGTAASSPSRCSAPRSPRPWAPSGSCGKSSWPPGSPTHTSCRCTTRAKRAGLSIT